VSGEARVPFEEDRAFAPEAGFHLEGPDGERIPGEGALRLPWRERGPERIG
jgi:hypothetical protein